MKPNFVIILADDLGYGDIGCYGCKHIRTPNIDRMASEGVQFTDFHSNGAVCSPTRAALVTGRYQQRSGVEGVLTAKGHRETGLPLDETTFAHVLADAGYKTAIFGKWHLGYPSEYNPVHFGFDEFRGYVSGNVDYHSHIDQRGFEDWWEANELVPEVGYTTDLVTAHGVDFIRRHAADGPFCLYLAHESPHYPYQGRDDEADRVVGQIGDAAGSRPDKENAYVEMIEALDDGVGAVLDELKAQDLDEQTLVIFCSDNGPAGFGSAGPFRGGKGNVYEGGHRLPGMARWPGKIEPGRESAEPILTMDFFPTMVALSGATATRELDGVDLTPVLLHDETLALRPLFWRHGQSLAVRHGNWKWVDGELYDLGADIAEANDISSECSEKAAEMAKLAEEWLADVTNGVERRS